MQITWTSEEKLGFSKKSNELWSSVVDRHDFLALGRKGYKACHHYLHELEQPAKWIGGKTARGLFGQAQPALFTGFGFVAKGSDL